MKTAEGVMDTGDESGSRGEPVGHNRRLIRRAWPAVKVIGSLALAAIALWVIYGRGSELQDVLFDQLHWEWLVPAVVVEALSFVAFAAMQYRLLGAGGVKAPKAPLLGTTLSAQAISNSFPGGVALASVYSFRWYRRFGADDAVAGWALGGTLVAASLALALVAALGVAIAAEQGASLGLIPVVLGVLGLAVAVAVLFVHQELLVAVVRWFLRGVRRVTGHPRGDVTVKVTQFAQRLAAVPLGWKGMATVTGWGLATWLLDCGCFALSFFAVGAGIPWKGLLLAYGAGQLAANLPITPGGLGVVEGSIEVALVFFGGPRAATVGAVFVYRLVSFWLELVVGWTVAGGLALGVRRGRWERQALKAPVSPGLTDIAPAGGSTQRAEGLA